MKFKIKNLNTLRPQKGKVSRRAIYILLHHFLQNRLSIFPPSLCPAKTSDSTKWATCICQIGAMRSMGVLRLYWIAQHICLSMSKLPMAWRIPPWPSPVNTGLWLTAFDTEVRKADGDYYSPASLNELLSDFWTFSDFKRSSCVHG